MWGKPGRRTQASRSVPGMDTISWRFKCSLEPPWGVQKLDLRQGMGLSRARTEAQSSLL